MAHEHTKVRIGERINIDQRNVGYTDITKDNGREDGNDKEKDADRVRPKEEMRSYSQTTRDTNIAPRRTIKHRTFQKRSAKMTN